VGHDTDRSIGYGYEGYGISAYAQEFHSSSSNGVGSLPNLVGVVLTVEIGAKCH